MVEEAQLVRQLESSDHLVVCAALKALSKSSSLSRESVQQILKRANRGTVAVERSALKALEQLGPRAAECLPTLLSNLASQLDWAGCTFDCCGIDAFHAPVGHYLAAILSVGGVRTMGHLEERVFPILKELPHAELLRQILESTASEFWATTLNGPDPGATK